MIDFEAFTGAVVVTESLDDGLLRGLPRLSSLNGMKSPRSSSNKGLEDGFARIGCEKW